MQSYTNNSDSFSFWAWHLIDINLLCCGCYIGSFRLNLMCLVPIVTEITAFIQTKKA